MAVSTTADRSTVVGFNAGDAMTTGGDNAIFGYEAGGSMTTAIENTYIGYYAGNLNTTTNYNTGVGSGALQRHTTGTRNTAVGARSLDAATTSSDNTAMGYDALGVQTTGTENVAVGSYALDATDDGASNTAVGYKALSANCSDSNTGIGRQAGLLCTGSNNTFLGKDAGSVVSSGSNNMLLGKDAGLSGSPGGQIGTESNYLTLADENITHAYVQVDWTIASDQRDKTDFTALDLGLDFVKDLKPVTYKWDKRSKYGDKTADDYDLNAQSPDGTHKEDWLDIGFKAQEVEALEIAAGYNKSSKTNLTTTLTSDGKQYGIQYNKFVPILVKAIQEQQTLIESLTARITTLEG